MGLENLRKQLDDIDDSIMGMILERIKVVESIGREKKKSDTPVHLPRREQAILRRLKDNNPDLDQSLIEDIMKRLFQESYKVEK